MINDFLMFAEIKPLLKENDVIFAYLFGSQVKNNANNNSDVDIAVYFKEKDKVKRFEKRLLLISKASQILKKEVEVIVLNDIKNNFLLKDILYEGKVFLDDSPDERFYFENLKQHQIIDYLNHLKYANISSAN